MQLCVIIFFKSIQIRILPIRDKGDFMSVTPVEFGVYLRKLRKDKGLTLEALGIEVDLTKQHLSNLENGRRGIPSPDLLKRLSGPLDVEYDTLMKKAGYWHENQDTEDKQKFERIYTEHWDDLNQLLELINAITDDDGLFPVYLHEDIYLIFGGWLDLDIGNNYSHHFDNSFYDYLRMEEDELDERYIKEMHEEFDMFYNYKKIKQALFQYKGRKHEHEFIEELLELINKHNLEIPTTKPTLQEIDLMELLKNDSILIRFNNKLITRDQRYMLLGYLKAQDYMGNFDKQTN